MKTSDAARAARLALLVGVSLLGAKACAQAAPPFSIGGVTYDPDRFIQWKLPKSLREISGLALDDQQRLFAHDDEQAVIHQVNYREGSRVKRFALGDPPLEGDFEGIAVANGFFYLITSRGHLYRAREGADGASVTYQLTKTGLGKQCEIEGLAYHATENALLIVCKTARQPSLQGYVTVFRWSLSRNVLLEDSTIQLDLAQVEPHLQARAFHPSGLDLSPVTGHLVIIAARERAIMELSMQGELRALVKLPGRHAHPQTEGIALTSRGDLILADEGSNRKGRLGVYSAN